MTDKQLDASERIVPPPSITREEAKVLNKAPLATLRATPASEQAFMLVSELAKRYPRPNTAKGQSYARKKTQVDYANAVAAFIADLLEAVERDFSEGWLRCSLKKETYTGQYITWHMFNGVRLAFTEAGLVDHQPGYPGAYGFGNPGPSHGKLSRFRATPSLLSACEAHGVTPATVHGHFRFEYAMPSEVIQLSQPARKTPDTGKVQALRAQVAALNSFFAQHSLHHPTVQHLGWVRKFHRATSLDGYRWNKGGRLYSYPQGTACYQSLSGDRRPEELRIDGESVVEIDIAASYLTIFYAWCDAQLDHDQDAYRGILGDTDLDRKVAKFWINASLSNGACLTKWSRENTKAFRDSLISPEDFDPKRYSMKKIKRKVLERHPLLQRWGGEIRGRVRDWGDLMFAESEIIIGAMQELMERGIPSLPVHDSLIVPWTKEGVAADVLKRQFRAHTGAVPKLRIKPEPF